MLSPLESAKCDDDFDEVHEADPPAHEMTSTSQVTTGDEPGETPEEDAAQLFVAGNVGSIWYAFHTKPRCEKKAAGLCDEMGLRHYLPLRRNTPKKKKGQRQYSFDVPLFPGYVFGCCSDEERLHVMRSGYLVQWLEVVDQDQLLEELTSVYVASRRGAGLILYPQLKRGRRIRVIRGPLGGIQGHISQRKDEFRLVLNISVLGTAVAVEVDMEDVELAVA